MKLHPEIRGLITLASVLFAVLALVSFIHEEPEVNRLGLVGYYIACSLLYLFGLGTYLIIGYFCRIGWGWLSGKKDSFSRAHPVYFCLLLVSVCFLLNLCVETVGTPPPFVQKRVFGEVYAIGSLPVYKTTRFNVGGVPFYYLYRDMPLLNLARLLSHTGVFIVFSVTALLSVVFLADIRTLPLLLGIVRNLQRACRFLGKMCRDFKRTALRKTASRNTTGCNVRCEEKLSDEYSLVSTRQLSARKMSAPLERSTGIADPEESGVHTVTRDPEKMKHHSSCKEVASTIDEPALTVTTLSDKKPALRAGSSHKDVYHGQYTRYCLPSLKLLTDPPKVDQPTLRSDLQKQAVILERTLQSFGIDAKVGRISCGPTVVLFEVLPPVGVKVQKIRVLENDIALNLQARSIRIIAPIPGKAAVGVEIPAPYPQEVSFKEMLNEHIKHKKALIPILLGQTVTGENIISDLTKMPHCIIAGATGSGKSVCINSIVMSILMTARPDEVRLLLIDPKKVELSAYTNLAHMIAPVITEAHGAYAALNWLVKEMQHRYEILKYLKLKNIQAFNQRRKGSEAEETPPFDIPERFSYFVAVIDEFADLMMASSSDLETPIARIAQMARAVGIHLILATQRPSREVITGLIKANFPSRVAFKVASRVNSQIIWTIRGRKLFWVMEIYFFCLLQRQA